MRKTHHVHLGAVGAASTTFCAAQTASPILLRVARSASRHPGARPRPDRRECASRARLLLRERDEFGGSSMSRARYCTRAASEPRPRRPERAPPTPPRISWRSARLGRRDGRRSSTTAALGRAPVARSALASHVRRASSAAREGRREPPGAAVVPASGASAECGRRRGDAGDAPVGSRVKKHPSRPQRPSPPPGRPGCAARRRAVGGRGAMNAPRRPRLSRPPWNARGAPTVCRAEAS